MCLPVLTFKAHEYCVGALRGVAAFDVAPLPAADGAAAAKGTLTV